MRPVEGGFEIFKCMYGNVVEPNMDFKCVCGNSVEPNIEHFVCTVGLLERSARLEEAEAFLAAMPIMPGPAVCEPCWVLLEC